MKNIKLAGVLFQYGEDDYDLWEGFSLTDEEENAIMAILNNHNAEGGSVRGTYNQIIKEN